MTLPTMLRYILSTSFYCTVLLLCQLLMPANSYAATGSGYAIVLSSSPGTGLKWVPIKNSLFDGYTFFVEPTTVKGKPWERLCLGYFDTRNQAVSLKEKIQTLYPGAWINRVSGDRVQSTVSPAPQKKPPPKARAQARPAAPSADKIGSLMQRAKTDFTDKKYPSAIRYLTAIIQAGDPEYSREALELLGLARQRNGQNAHAVDIYEKYLVLYPTGEDSDRVRQRLAGVLTASSKPRDKIKLSKQGDNINEITTRGSLQQSYLNYQTTTDDIGTLTTLSQLNTFLNVTTTHGSGMFDHRYQFTADHSYDFIDNEDSSDSRFLEAYYELSHRKTGASGRLGRQILRIGGIRKRYDGLSAGYQINPDMRLNVLAGFPVDIDNKTSINKQKTFYGFTFETGTFLKFWDMNLFYLDQEVDGLTDSNNIGTDVRYRDKNKSFYGVVDYDMFYNEVNILQFNTSILFGSGRTAYLNALMNKAPILATSNALIGRPERTIEELNKTLNIEQIYQLARDRTANSQTLTIGGTQPISEKYRASADITLYQVDGTNASAGDALVPAGIPATEDTGTEYYLSAQLVGDNLLTNRDTSVLGVRYYDTALSNTISLIANIRFPVMQNWRLNPRLQLDIRELNDGRSVNKLRALLRTDYRYLKKIQFNFEIGYDAISDSNDGPSLANNNLFFIAGYHWDF